MKTVWSNVKKSLDCTSESSSDVYDPGLSSKPRTSTRSRFSNVCCDSLEPSSPQNSIPKSPKSSRISYRDDHSSRSSTRKFTRDDRVYESYSRYVQSISGYNDSPISYEFRGYGSGYLVQGSHRNDSLRYFDSGEFPISTESPLYTNTTPISCSLEKQGRLTHGCPLCRERVPASDAVCSRHAVSIDVSGEFRLVVEKICTKNWSKSEITSRQIEHVVKVCTLEKARSQFNEYKEMVIRRANELKDEDSRRLVHGNEQRRFYGTTIACDLGVNDSSTSLCGQDICGVCRILKCGFSSERELKNGMLGIMTCGTTEKALETINLPEENKLIKKALLVCRVIVGRVLEELVNIAESIYFDSFSEESLHKLDDIGELYSFSPKALLPCFVVILGH